MTAASSTPAFIVERKVKGAWRMVQTAPNDRSAAQLARSLVGQSPGEAVRIVLRLPGDGAEAPTRVVWEYGGRTENGAISVPASGLEAGRGDAMAPGPLGEAVQPAVTNAAARRSRRTVVAGMSAVIVLLILLSLSPLLDLGGRSAEDGGPTPDTAATQVGQGQPAERRPAQPLDDAALSYRHDFIARQYAYMSCLVENLGSGLEIVRESYRQGRINEDLLRTYDLQFQDVYNDYVEGRRTLGGLTREEGGLSPLLMDFIDDWFRLNKDFLWAGRRYDDIVNPEQMCRAEADRGAYLEAYRQTRDGGPRSPWQRVR